MKLTLDDIKQAKDLLTNQAIDNEHLASNPLAEEFLNLPWPVESDYLMKLEEELKDIEDKANKMWSKHY